MGRKAAESQAAHSSRRHLIAKEKRGAIRGATLQDARARRDEQAVATLVAQFIDRAEIEAGQARGTGAIGRRMEDLGAKRQAFTGRVPCSQAEKDRIAELRTAVDRIAAAENCPIADVALPPQRQRQPNVPVAQAFPSGCLGISTSAARCGVRVGSKSAIGDLGGYVS